MNQPLDASTREQPWTASSVPLVETKGDTIRAECQCSTCGGTGLLRARGLPLVAETCTSCAGGGRKLVYLTAWTGRRRLEGVETVRAHEHVPEMPYERWLESVVPVVGGAVEYRLEGTPR